MIKIGPHIIGGWSGPLGRPRLVKLVNVSPLYVRQVRAETDPMTLIIVRWEWDRPDLREPEMAAASWMRDHGRDIMAMTAGGSDKYIAFEALNEPTADQAEAVVRFETRRLELMHRAGYRSVVGNFSVGCPDLADWGRYHRMLAALAYGDALGLHEYWTDHADLANRYHVARWTLAPALQGLPIIVTECGRDVVEGRGKPGWQHTCGPDEYLADLAAYDEIISRDSNVYGATVFSLGQMAPEFRAFDAAPIWPALVARQQSRAPETNLSIAGQRRKDDMIIQKSSPNWGYPRGQLGRNGQAVDGIIYHIAEGSLAGLDGWLQSPDSQVSYHYAVGKAGAIHQYVDADNAAWHAGHVEAPRWPRLRAGVNPNLHTIGVALEGRSGEPVSEAAYQSLLALTKRLLADYKIPGGADALAGHCDIDSRNRANCPGPTFPWQRLRRDLGLEETKTMRNESLLGAIREAAWNAAGVAYNPDAALARYARAQGLGNPVTPEYDVEHGGQRYRAQGFAKGIVMAAVGRWDDCQVLDW